MERSSVARKTRASPGCASFTTDAVETKTFEREEERDTTFAFGLSREEVAEAQRIERALQPNPPTTLESSALLPTCTG
jgi:hypothetical protein